MSDHAPWVDLLTGAWRREHFEEALSQAVSRARRAKTPLSLLWLDIDDLCEHNDLHGQDAVDAALAHLASRVAELLDGQGPLARVHGGAFAVILEGMGETAARALGERLRRLAPKTLHASAFGDFRLTLSIGISPLRRSQPWGNLLDAVQEACHRAKVGGRDAVVSR